MGSMLRVSGCLRRNFRSSIKYPALISYNKLPWEVVDHTTVALHMHLAPFYEQVLRLASTTHVPRMVCTQHRSVPALHRLRVLPGTVYLMPGPMETPADFAAHRVTDPSALQYYGRLCSTTAARSLQVNLLTSDDLRLLCLAVHLTLPPPTADHTTINTRPPSSLSQLLSAGSHTSSTDSHTGESRSFTLYHYFRPNRPATELTRPLEQFYVHRADTSALDRFAGEHTWTPQLGFPARPRGARVSALPAYRPPQSYLMGLAERLAVIPGNCFGRRSLMWGMWF